MSTKKAIRQLVERNSYQFKNLIESELTEKAQNLVDVARTLVGSSYLGQVNELSTKTLGNYLHKSQKDKMDRMTKIVNGEHTEKDIHKIKNRIDSQETAKNKFVKKGSAYYVKEDQINELAGKGHLEGIRDTHVKRASYYMDKIDKEKDPKAVNRMSVATSKAMHSIARAKKLIKHRDKVQDDDE